MMILLVKAVFGELGDMAPENLTSRDTCATLATGQINCMSYNELLTNDDLATIMSSR